MGIDVFARKNHLYIEDMQKAKANSAKILEGKTVVAAIESGRDSIEGTVPEEVKIVPETYENPDIYIGIYERKLSSHVLRLIPKTDHGGIGCRRGTSAEQIEQLVDKILKESHINKKSIGRPTISPSNHNHTYYSFNLPNKSTQHTTLLTNHPSFIKSKPTHFSQPYIYKIHTLSLLLKIHINHYH